MKHAILLIVCPAPFLRADCTAKLPQSHRQAAAHRDPYEIASLENVYWIAASTSRWQEDYIQTANIDASETSSWNPIVQVGWTPIGNFTTKE